ncbi:MAG TPA: PQQ-binding-like beta-propeller repeat protein [Ktedonobacterales bacterium]
MDDSPTPPTPPKLPIPPDPPKRPRWTAPDQGHAIARSVGGTAGCLGALGALATFIMPWFIFVAAIQLGCRAPLQVELYQLTGATLVVSNTPGVAQHFAQAALIAVIGVGIAALMAVRRPTRLRAGLLMTLAVVGAALIGTLGWLAASGRVTLTTFVSAYYLGLGSGWWFALAAFGLALAGGAGLHAAARPVWRRGVPVGEMAVATLGVAGLVAALVGTVVVPLAPYPSLSCAPPVAGVARAGPGVVYSATAASLDTLDATSGAVIWRCQNPLGGIVTAGPPPLVDGALIVESRDGVVYAVRASDAAILWQRNVGGRGLYVNQTPSAAPIVADGVIFGVNGAGNLFALRASDGASAWAPAARIPLAWPAPQVTLVGSELLYIANVNGLAHVTALDAGSGRLVWQAPDALEIAGYPPQRPLFVVADGVVYSEGWRQSTGVISLVARSLTDGSERWSVSLGVSTEITPSMVFVASGAVYVVVVGTQGPGASSPPTQQVEALRTSDGARLWTAALSGQAVNISDLAGTSWATDGAQVYLALVRSGSNAETPGESIYVFAPRNGRLVWRRDMTPMRATTAPIHISSLALVGTSLYLLDPEKTLSAIDAGSGAILWQANEASPTPVSQSGQSGMASLTLDPADGALYVGGNRLTAVDMASGATRWESIPSVTTTPYTGQYWAPSVAPPTFGG